MKRILILALVATAMSSCIDFSGTKKIQSTGSPYEIILVTTQARWNGELGDTLRSILLKPVELINQTEPIFNLYFMKPEGFTGIVERNLNIISVKVDPEYKEPEILAQFDVYAAPQIFITLVGPTQEAITKYVSEHRDVLVEYLEQAHRDRYLNNIKQYNVKSIATLIKDKFGFEMDVPKGYTVRSEKPNFLWLSFEYPQASQGVVIFSSPYTNKEDFVLDSLVVRQNHFTALIPGPSQGSYMTTNAEYAPEVDYMRIYGRSWARLRGFWDVKGDFMGGPFTSYSTLDTKSNRIITIYTYLYSPKQNKRNYLRELQTLVYGVKVLEN